MRRFWYTVKPLILAVLAFGVYVWAIVKWDIWAFAGVMGLIALAGVAAWLRQRWMDYPKDWVRRDSEAERAEKGREE